VRVRLRGFGLAGGPREVQNRNVNQMLKAGAIILKALSISGALICVSGGVCEVQGAQATYTLSTVGSGHIGLQTFTLAHVTIISTADTSQITNSQPGIFHVPDITATVFVSDIGTATFTIPTINVANQNNSRVGFSAPNQGLAILFADNNPPFHSYDLSTSLGPLTGSASFNSGVSFMTTLGSFSLTSVSDVTFQAVVVPEPSIPALVGFVLMCVVSRFGWRCGVSRA
jgi:hypothetical protein